MDIQSRTTEGLGRHHAHAEIEARCLTPLLTDAKNGGITLLASICNQRSLVYVGNLAEAITCIDAPDAAGKTYLVSDGEDLSTPVLIRKLATALGKPPRLLPYPPALLRSAATLFGKQAAVTRLTGSLAVDSSALRYELGWQPRYSLDQGLNATARWYHRGQN